MGDKLRANSKANARTQKLLDSSSSGSTPWYSDCAGEGNDKPPQYSYQEHSVNRQSTKFQDMVLEDETPRSDSTEKMTGEGLRPSTSGTVNNDAIGTKPKGSPIAEK